MNARDESTCAKCGVVAVPTPWADFYHCASPALWPNAADELCEVCFRSQVANYMRARKATR